MEEGGPSRKQAHIRLPRIGTSLATRPTVANPGSKLLFESTMTSAAARPVCDEWGMYDPEQAGFEAIIRRLFPEDNAAPRSQASSLPHSGAGATR
jgi:hypothetical protein